MCALKIIENNSVQGMVMHCNNDSFSELLRIVARLRDPDGCPWDRKQTAQTFKSYVIEEAHELLEAIDADDPEHIREELGDLLFQLVFLTRLYEEKNLFAMKEVIRSISEKMIRRHPHVFGGVEAGTDEELRRRWHEIKSSERAGRQTHPFTSVPRSLPALRRAQRISERAAKMDESRLTLSESLRTLEKETGDIAGALEQGKGTMAIGDLFFTMVEVCRLADINAEDALQAATDRHISKLPIH
jgi:MazG family protein